MNKVLFYFVLLFICILLVIYMAFAFVCMELNPLCWSEGSRFLFALFNVIVSLVFSPVLFEYLKDKSN